MKFPLYLSRRFAALQEKSSEDGQQLVNSVGNWHHFTSQNP